MPARRLHAKPELRQALVWEPGGTDAIGIAKGLKSLELAHQPAPEDWDVHDQPETYGLKLRLFIGPLLGGSVSLWVAAEEALLVVGADAGILGHLPWRPVCLPLKFPA